MTPGLLPRHCIKLIVQGDLKHPRVTFGDSVGGAVGHAFNPAIPYTSSCFTCFLTSAAVITSPAIRKQEIYD